MQGLSQRHVLLRSIRSIRSNHLRKGCSMGISRRDFLMRVGHAGGYSAAFVAMQHMGLMPMYGEQWKPIQAAPDSGKGVKVVVLGGGPGGLVTAYEMKKLGYDV